MESDFEEYSEIMLNIDNIIMFSELKKKNCDVSLDRFLWCDIYT